MSRRFGIGKRSLAGNAAWVTFCIAAVLAAAAMQPGGLSTANSPELASGRVPATADAVVLRLDRDSALKELPELRERLDAQPADSAAASRFATLALQHFAYTGDARFLGYAEGALRHWEDDPSPPPAIWLLRGRILQTRHSFQQAAEDLDRMLATHPGSLEAMLLAADAWRRSGALDKAWSRCAALASAGRADLARFCAADVLLSAGAAEEALRAALVGQAGADRVTPEVAKWALALTADAAAAAGRIPLSESSYRRALALPGPSIALHVAYADLLLRDDRPREALDLLEGLPRADAVLLRRAMAAKRLGLEDFAAYRVRLLENFAEARALGAGRLHLREQAMFELHVEGDPAAALRVARENWEIQKGPEDAAVLLEAADAAGAPEVGGAVHAWRQQFQRHAT